MCPDEKLLQFLMSKDYLQERHQNIPPASLIEQMV
jgi:hypothetical protein